MNERMQQLRKELKLSQEIFGKKLGISKSAISNMESGRYNITDTLIELACQKFSVNEEWLRTGNGEMFVVTDDTLISQLKEKGYDALTCKIIKTYLSIPPAHRDVFNEKLVEFADALHGESKQSRLVEELTPSNYIEPDKWEAETDRAQAILDAQKMLDSTYNKDAKKEKLSS